MPATVGQLRPSRSITAGTASRRAMTGRVSAFAAGAAISSSVYDHNSTCTAPSAPYRSPLTGSSRGRNSRRIRAAGVCDRVPSAINPGARPVPTALT